MVRASIDRLRSMKLDDETKVIYPITTGKRSPADQRSSSMRSPATHLSRAGLPAARRQPGAKAIAAVLDPAPQGARFRRRRDGGQSLPTAGAHQRNVARWFAIRRAAERCSLSADRLGPA